MTSFQRMVLVAAVLFMITAHVTDAEIECGCFSNGKCAGLPERGVGPVSDYNLPCTCSMEIVHY